TRTVSDWSGAFPCRSLFLSGISPLPLPVREPHVFRRTTHFGKTGESRATRARRQDREPRGFTRSARRHGPDPDAANNLGIAPGRVHAEPGSTRRPTSFSMSLHVRSLSGPGCITTRPHPCQITHGADDT